MATESKSPETPKTSLQSDFLPPIANRPAGVFVEAARIQKFPSFYRPDPAFWFEQVEAAFHTNHITSDETRFKYVIQFAEPEILPHVISIARNPPATNKYEAVKERILAAFAESAESKLRRLFQGKNLEGKRPSHYLQDLRNTGGEQVTDAMLRSLLLEQLPENIRMVLAISNEADVDKLAKMADLMIEMQQLPCISTVQKAPTENDVLEQILSRIDRLEITTRNRSRSKQRSTRRQRSGSRNRGFCFFHQRFGKQARNCRPPCKWQNNSATSEN